MLENPLKGFTEKTELTFLIIQGMFFRWQLKKVTREHKLNVSETVIAIVSRGILSEDSIKYLSELNRPLDEKDSVKLFATNGLVDK
jgi:hypothetical protein